MIEVRVVLETLAEGTGEFDVEERIHPLAIILTQDCDLIWDYRARHLPTEQQAKQANKLLPNVLFCELETADELKGNQSIASDIWRRIRQNQDERYHHLGACDPEFDLDGGGFPPLAIDFKRVFTVPPDELYHRLSTGQIRRRCALTGAFLQDLSNRFGYYHLRVALPDMPGQVAQVALPAPSPGQILAAAIEGSTERATPMETGGNPEGVA